LTKEIRFCASEQLHDLVPRTTDSRPTALSGNETAPWGALRSFAAFKLVCSSNQVSADFDSGCPTDLRGPDCWLVCTTATVPPQRAQNGDAAALTGVRDAML